MLGTHYYFCFWATQHTCIWVNIFSGFLSKFIIVFVSLTGFLAAFARKLKWKTWRDQVGSNMCVWDLCSHHKFLTVLSGGGKRGYTWMLCWWIVLEPELCHVLLLVAVVAHWAISIPLLQLNGKLKCLKYFAVSDGSWSKIMYKL